MKKVTGVLLAILLCWNVFLTTQVLNFEQSGDTRNIVNQSVSKITTDLTELVEVSENKVVGVATYYKGTEISTGSGVVYSSGNDGVTIVTNNHVIENGDQHFVKFANGEQYQATIVGGDSLTDIAVMTVNPDFEVEPFNIGDSSLVSVGEYVIAIGTPLGLDFQGSTTFGIISGTDRIIPVDLNGDGFEDWDSILLQTDAAINPGNSGGALINLAGELIGITSMKFSSDKIEGMGFAIPSNEVISIVNQIQTNGKVIRPILGVSGVGVSSLSNPQKSYMAISLDQSNGVYIQSVAKSSAAAKAGIEVGDIIMKINGHNITSYKSFRVELYKYQVNDKIEIELLRDGKTVTLTAVLQ